MSGKPRRVLNGALSRAKADRLRTLLADAGVDATTRAKVLADLRHWLPIAAEWPDRFSYRRFDVGTIDRFIGDTQRFSRKVDEFGKASGRQTIWSNDGERIRLAAHYGAGWRETFRPLLVRLRSIADDLVALPKHIEPVRVLVHQVGWFQRKGTSAREDVRLLLGHLAWLFIDLELPLTKTRSGLFVRVAELVHPDTKDPDAPVTIAFPIIQRAIDIARRNQEVIESDDE